MRILIAPSGYKESLQAEEVCEVIATGLRRAAADAQIVQIPIADGGEGTATTMAAITGGAIHPVRVTGPVGQLIDSHFATLGGEGPLTAVVELAAAAGLRHVPRNMRNPLRTTSIGVGELMLAALEHGARRIIVGCGDSGVNDGGAGLLQALGARLLDRANNPIEPTGEGLAQLERIDLDGLDPRLQEVELLAACNIRNVLTGPDGVARLFGPQKGASPEDVETLSLALERYADAIENATGRDVRTMPGCGASGGVGAALHGVLGGTLHSRFDLLLPYFPLDEEIAQADLVITAEGGLDYKTARGKIPAEIGERGAAAGVPVIVLAGGLGERPEEVLQHGISAFFSTVAKPESLQEAMNHARDEVALMAEHVLRCFLCGAAYGRKRRG